MTAEQYDNAIEALAVLIGRWLQDHPDPCPDCMNDDKPGSAAQLAVA
jgi:hypothetical protein